MLYLELEAFSRTVAWTPPGKRFEPPSAGALGEVFWLRPIKPIAFKRWYLEKNEETLGKKGVIQKLGEFWSKPSYTTFFYATSVLWNPPTGFLWDFSANQGNMTGSGGKTADLFFCSECTWGLIFWFIPRACGEPKSTTKETVAHSGGGWAIDPKVLRRRVLRSFLVASEGGRSSFGSSTSCFWRVWVPYGRHLDDKPQPFQEPKLGVWGVLDTRFFGFLAVFEDGS